MKLKISDFVTLNYITKYNCFDKQQIPIIFLHGFTGNANDWTFIFDSINPDFFPILLDLPGHGNSTLPDDPEFYTTEKQIEYLDFLLDYFQFDKLILCGYSMGGRLAFSYAAKHPEKISALIIESATPGIPDSPEKFSRYKSDQELATFILNNPIELFLNEWYSKDLFKNLSVKKKEIIETKKNLSPEGLANSLLGFSTGIMPSIWSELINFNFPLLLINGSEDEKFLSVSEKIKQILPATTHKTIENAGHNVHLEKAGEFTIFVTEYLNNLKGTYL